MQLTQSVQFRLTQIETKNKTRGKWNFYFFKEKKFLPQVGQIKKDLLSFSVLSNCHFVFLVPVPLGLNCKLVSSTWLHGTTIWLLWSKSIWTDSSQSDLYQWSELIWCHFCTYLIYVCFSSHLTFMVQVDLSRSGLDQQSELIWCNFCAYLIYECFSGQFTRIILFNF